MTAAITRGWRAPLPWLGGLLLLYLLIPLVAFVVRLPTIPRAEMAAPGVMDALVVSLVTATISAAIVTVLGVPLGYVLAQSHGRIASVLGATPACLATSAMVTTLAPPSVEAFRQHYG